jgi:hypothetical protein
MRQVLVLAACTSLGCGHRDDASALAAPAPAVAGAANARPSAGVPHGSTVEVVAITEQADAAISADAIGGLRLWPSLDGTRPPIVIGGPIPEQLALAHAGDELVAGLLDQAGNVRVLRFAKDGSVRGRVQLPGDVAHEQVIAVDGGILVRRRDQSIERFDASGISRGRLVAEPGEQIGAIASRHGTVAALITSDVRGQAKRMRWIVGGDELRWGTTVTLPAAISSAVVALSPNQHRVAGIDVATSQLQVFELDPLPKPVHGATVVAMPEGATVGFVDDDHVVVVRNATESNTPEVQWWVVPSPSHDPWATTPATPPPAIPEPSSSGAAIGDGIVVTGFASGLAIGDSKRTRYLGWATLASGELSQVGARFVFSASSTKLTWLDADLAHVRDLDLTTLTTFANNVGTAVGEHHVVVERKVDSKYVVELVDLDRPGKPVDVGAFTSVDRIDFHAPTSVLAIAEGRLVHRYQLALATSAVAALPSLAMTVQPQKIWLLDPTRAHGVIAVALGWGDDGQKLQTFRTPVGRATTLDPASSVMVVMPVLLVDGAGTTYHSAVEPPTPLVAEHGRKEVARYDLDAAVTSVIDSHDATSLAVTTAHEVAMFAATGAKRWRHPMIDAVGALFDADDRRLIVRSQSGIVILDAATGAQVEAVCGWSFGLHDEPPAATTFGAPPVCEDTARP